MPPAIATIICTIGIIGLFYLDRGRGQRMSRGLWIVAIWLFLNSSRPLSTWLEPSIDAGGADTTQALVEGNPLDRDVFTVLVLSALVILVIRSSKVRSVLRRNLPILLYLSFCLISILWSDFQFVSFKRWFKSVGDVEMVLLVLTETDPFSSLICLLTRLGFLLFPFSILFIKYYPELGSRMTQSWSLEATGVATQKNALGLICMMYGVGFIWMCLSAYREKNSSSRHRHLLAYGTILAMIIWLLSQCRSTTSITGFVAAGVVTWLISSHRVSKPAAVHLLVSIVLGLAVTAIFFDPGGGMVGALGKNPTLTGRTDIWKLALSLHTNPWIGTGYESFWLGQRLDFMLHALPNFPVNEAHNGYLEVYLNLGWLGIALIALLLGTGYRRIISAARQDPTKGSLFVGFFICTLYYSFTEASFRLMSVSWIFLLLVVMGSTRVVSLASSYNQAKLRVGPNGVKERPAQAGIAAWIQ